MIHQTRTSITVAAIMTLLLGARSLHAADQLSFLSWIDKPEAYFATADEREAFKRVLSAAQFEDFIKEYWEKRGEAFHAEVRRRIEFADKQFGLPERAGSQTERGRVWITLGSPSFERTDREQSGPGSMGGDFGGASANTLDRQAIVLRTWTYKKDRLPKELGVPELVVKFQTDIRKGYEVIENPGLVEPYLKRAAAHVQNTFISAAGTSKVPAAAITPTTASAIVPMPSDDSIWSASQLNGALFTGESFISATEKPFYAIDFYLPKKGALANIENVTVAGVIRDKTGQKIASLRIPAKTVTYDAGGDRFVDASFDLPPGHYSGSFALATEEGKLLAATKSEFEVIPSDHVGMSQLLMTDRIDTLENQRPFDPFTFVAMKYAIKGDRRFHPSDKIGYFAAVSNPTASPVPSMVLKMKVTKDGKPFASTPPEPAVLTQTGPHTYLIANQFDAGTFKPGHYTLEVQLRDINAPKTSDAYTKGFVSSSEFDVVE